MKNFKDVYNKVDSCTILVTNDCNLACDYCFEKNKGKEYISPSRIIEIADLVYRDDKENPFEFSMFGGEPMLNWKTIKAILDHIGNNNWNTNFSITTNLTILTDEILYYINKYNIHLIASVGGIREAHNLHRCDSFDKVYTNLLKLVYKRYQDNVNIRLTVTPDNVKYLYESIYMFLNLGFNIISPVIEFNSTWNDESLSILKENYKKVLYKYFDIMNKEDNIRNLNIFHIDNIITLPLEPSLYKTKKCCNSFNKRWVITDYNGDIWGCQDFILSDNDNAKHIGRLGNIYTGIDESKLKEESTITLDFKECNYCDAKDACNPGCLYNNYIHTGNFYSIDRNYCKIEKVFVSEMKDFRNSLLDSLEIKSYPFKILCKNLSLKRQFKNIKSIDDLNEFSNNLNYLYKDNLVLETFESYFKNNMNKLITRLKLIGGY